MSRRPSWAWGRRPPGWRSPYQPLASPPSRRNCAYRATPAKAPWVQLVLLAGTALTAVGAAWYGRRSADAALKSAETAISSATAAEEALRLDIERLERLRQAEEEARRPKVLVRIVRTPQGFDAYERAEAVIENLGESTAASIEVRLASLDHGIELSGRVPALRGRGETVVPCIRSSGTADRPQGSGWVAATTWQSEQGDGYGDLSAWTSVSFEETKPAQSPPRARLERSP